MQSLFGLWLFLAGEDQNHKHQLKVEKEAQLLFTVFILVVPAIVIPLLLVIVFVTCTVSQWKCCFCKVFQCVSKMFDYFGGFFKAWLVFEYY